jgi:hypothetical protein
MAEGRMPIPTIDAATVTGNVSSNASAVEDVYDRLRQERSTTRASVGTSMQTTKLEALNQEQIQCLLQIDGKMATLIDLMTPKSVMQAGSANIATSRSQASPAKATDYARWQFGMQSGNPSTGEVNTGVT